MLVTLLLGVALASLVTASFAPQVKADAQPGLVYATNFDSVTRQDANRLNMGISNWFEFGGDGGAAMWVEGLDRVTSGVTCHSGVRCVGMELTNLNESRRNEFNIMHLENLVGNELYVSAWLYLPADWALHSPSWNSYEIANPYFTDSSYLPYSAIHINENPCGSPFQVSLGQRDLSGTFTNLQDSANYPLPRGQWFNLQYYVDRSVSNGAIKVWINGNLVSSVVGISTESPSVTQWFTTPAKIYYELSDTFSPYRMWVDDMSIYNTQPSSLTSTTTVASSSISSSTATSSTITTTSATTTSSATSTTTSSTSSSTASATTSSTITTPSNSTSDLVVKRRH